MIWNSKYFRYFLSPYDLMAQFISVKVKITTKTPTYLATHAMNFCVIHFISFNSILQQVRNMFCFKLGGNVISPLNRDVMDTKLWLISYLSEHFSFISWCLFFGNLLRNFFFRTIENHSNFVKNENFKLQFDLAEESNALHAI